MKTEKNIARIDDLIAGYFAQELKREELTELQQWLKASVGNKTYFLQAQELWFSAISANHAVRFDSEKAFERFLTSKISLSKQTVESVVLKPQFRLFEFDFRKVAAAVALLVIFAGIGYLVGDGRFSGQLADLKVEVPYGSKTKLRLPDGSFVWLNAGSKLLYSRDFGVENRNIELIGEGYFEVTKNKALPFEVKTKEVTVRVLGTKFNFRNYGMLVLFIWIKV